MSQSFGQACSLHAVFSVRSGHLAPPCVATSMTLRRRPCTPPPHVTEQAVFSIQAVTVQATGHSWWLQNWMCDREPQAWPPSAASRTTVRVLVWNPMPQDLEHTL
jgi:hypothetical protein